MFFSLSYKLNTKEVQKGMCQMETESRFIMNLRNPALNSTAPSDKMLFTGKWLLRTTLLHENGQMALKELDETLAEAGFTPKVMRTAKAEMENDGKVIRERTTAEDPETGKKSAKWLVRQVTEAKE